MSKHDFSHLLSRYPATIEEMHHTFTSHEFILCLARENQVLYVDALHSYCQRGRASELATPFKAVHAILAQQLLEFPHLVELMSESVQSRNIFGRDNSCAQWKKIE